MKSKIITEFRITEGDLKADYESYIRQVVFRPGCASTLNNKSEVFIKEGFIGLNNLTVNYILADKAYLKTLCETSLFHGINSDEWGGGKVSEEVLLSIVGLGGTVYRTELVYSHSVEDHLNNPLTGLKDI